MGCKFSFKRVFLVASLALAGLFGVSSFFASKDNNMRQASASTPDTIYVGIKSDWNKNNGGLSTVHATFYDAYCDRDDLEHHNVGPAFNGVLVNYTEGNNYASVSVPAGAVYVVFTNKNADSSQAMTEPQLIPDTGTGKNTFVITTNYGWYAVNYRQNGEWTDFDSWGAKRPDIIYLDVSTSYWATQSNMHTNWGINFFDKNGDTLVSGFQRINDSERMVTKFDDGRKYNDSGSLTGYNIYSTFIYAIAVPSGAQSVEVQGWNTYNKQDYTGKITLPYGDDVNKNLLSIYGKHTSGSHQEVIWRENPYEIPDTIFFKFTGTIWNTWASGDTSKIKAYFYNKWGVNNTFPGVNGYAVEEGGDTYIGFDVPYYATTCIFTAFDGKDGGRDASQNRSQSFSLCCNDIRTYTIITSSVSANQTIGYYLLEDTYDYITGTTPSLSTARVFLSNTADTLEGIWRGCNIPNARIGLRCWGGSASDDDGGPMPEFYSTIYYFTWFNGQGNERTTNEWETRYYGYVDIPINTGRFMFVLTQDDGEEEFGLLYPSGPYIEVTEDSFAGVYYLMGSKSDQNTAYRDRYATVSFGAMTHNSTIPTTIVGPALMEKVLNAYSTCSDSKYNGCGNIELLKTNFYINASMNPSESIDCADNKIVSTLLPGTDPSTGSSYQQSVRDTISIMEARNSSKNFPGLSRSKEHVFGLNVSDDNTSVILIIIASSISILSITVLSVLLVKKRKSQ